MAQHKSWDSCKDGVWVCWASQTGASEEIARQLSLRITSSPCKVLNVAHYAANPINYTFPSSSKVTTATATATTTTPDSNSTVNEAVVAVDNGLDEAQQREWLGLHRRIVVFVVSSTGQGEPPEHSLAFMRWLRSSKPSFQAVDYAILGLGDTNYDSYQGNPKNLDRLMQSLGANRMLARGEADEATGYVNQPIRTKYDTCAHCRPPNLLDAKLGTTR
jgi:sulfite reductase alpha subunit-like flavoprotein